MNQRIMNQPLNFEELKIEAQKRNHLVIRPEGATAWSPLKNWRGHPASIVVYDLIGNKVVVRAGLENSALGYILA